MFSIYMGPGRMTNVMTNKSTSISFVPQMPVHQEPVTSLIFHGRAGTKQGTCGTSEWQLTDETTSLKTVGFFFFFLLVPHYGWKWDRRVLSLVFFGVCNCAPAGRSLCASKSACNLDGGS